MENLQYPIGKFEDSNNWTEQQIKEAISDFKEFPSLLEKKILELKPEDLKKTYREGGWSIQQLVHHLADSHANMYTRVKFAIDEDNPTIKGYNEASWAKMPDYEMDLSYPLMMIKGMHAKIAKLFEDGVDLERTYYHAGYDKKYTLKSVINLYAWHGKHHLEHINIAQKS